MENGRVVWQQECAVNQKKLPATLFSQRLQHWSTPHFSK
jgi:hypothetical protein